MCYFWNAYLCPQCENYGNLLSHCFEKIFVKTTPSPKIIIKLDLTKYFFDNSKFTFFHTVCYFSWRSIGEFGEIAFVMCTCTVCIYLQEFFPWNQLRIIRKNKSLQNSDTKKGLWSQYFQIQFFHEFARLILNFILKCIWNDFTQNLYYSYKYFCGLLWELLWTKTFLWIHFDKKLSWKHENVGLEVITFKIPL